MVCQRCISAVSEILLGLEIKAIQITLGKVQIENNLNKTLESKLNNELLNQGFELLTSAKISLVNQIKSLIINEVHHNSQKTQNNFSNLLSNRLNYSYDYLSHQFSEIENKSIEKFGDNKIPDRAKVNVKTIELVQIPLKETFSSTILDVFIVPDKDK